MSHTYNEKLQRLQRVHYENKENKNKKTGLFSSDRTGNEML